MSTFLMLIGFVFLIMSLVGLISPKIVLGKWGAKVNRFQTFMIFIFLFVACVVGGTNLSMRDYDERKKKEETELAEKKKVQPKPEIAVKPETSVAKAAEEKPKDDKKTDSQPAVPKPVEKASHQTAKSPESKSISVSYAQVMKNLSNFFIMGDTNITVDKRVRYSGHTPTYTALLEIIGDKENIESTTLIIATPKDSPSIRDQNTAITLIFIQNVMPEWKDSNTWIVQSFKKIAKSQNNISSKVVGNKKITVKYVAPIGIMLVIEHK